MMIEVAMSIAKPEKGNEDRLIDRFMEQQKAANESETQPADAKHFNDYSDHDLTRR